MYITSISRSVEDMHEHRHYIIQIFRIHQIYVCLATKKLLMGQKWPLGRQLNRPGVDKYYLLHPLQYPQLFLFTVGPLCLIV